jgi:hypothetical protein
MKDTSTDTITTIAEALAQLSRGQAASSGTQAKTAGPAPAGATTAAPSVLMLSELIQELQNSTPGVRRVLTESAGRQAAEAEVALAALKSRQARSAAEADPKIAKRLGAIKTEAKASQADAKAWKAQNLRVFAQIENDLASLGALLQRAGVTKLPTLESAPLSSKVKVTGSKKRTRRRPAAKR